MSDIFDSLGHQKTRVLREVFENLKFRRTAVFIVQF